MEYLVIPVVALLASGLTLLSGFGLGTLLLPAFTLFFPVEMAVAATAVVHLVNNLFKLGLLRRHVDWAIAARFVVPAGIGAVLGALLLERLAGMAPLASYELAGGVHQVRPVQLVVGLMIGLFAVVELSPALRDRIRIGRGAVPVGGALSGFFGGLSGHQGALRSIVLLRSGLAKAAFIATGVAASLVIDLARLAVYAAGLSGRFAALPVERLGVLAAAVVAALLGAVLGVRTMGKITMTTVHRLVGVLLVLSGTAIAAGLI